MRDGGRGSLIWGEIGWVHIPAADWAFLGTSEFLVKWVAGAELGLRGRGQQMRQCGSKGWH